MSPPRCRRSRRHKQPAYPVRRSCKDEEEEVSSFFSSSFDAATTATPMDVTPVDAVKEPAKDGLKEKTADGTAGVDVLLTCRGCSKWNR